MLAGVVAYAAATWPASHTTGTKISAADIDGYLNNLDTRITSITGAKVFTDLTLQNGWTPTPLYTKPGYTKTADGFVHLRGNAKSGGASSLPDGTLLATLPSGYRPAASGEFVISKSTAGGGAFLGIDTSGNISVYGMSGASYLSLESVTFYADGN
jgi:hypothetical protein